MFIIRLTMNRDAPKPAKSPSPSVMQEAPAGRQRVDVVDLMAGRRDVVLVHGAEEYLLRITNQGKLILTK
ncbi:MAG: hemin uptake protein HemP [Pseudomonadota bacterium]